MRPLQIASSRPFARSDGDNPPCIWYLSTGGKTWAWRPCTWWMACWLLSRRNHDKVQP
ncbi:unnamed protein product [Ectocarpus sp. CCAP 1310/34]|nr:unnamed protein product [Ectocarpus sp. CCAP 1310/34]